MPEFETRSKRLAAEFVVIVLGVLTALLGESLASSLNDRADSVAIQARLADDLRQESMNLARLESLYLRVIDSGRVTLDWLRTGQTELRDGELIVHVVNAMLNQPFAATTATWDDVRNTGRLEIVPESRRLAVASYYVEFQRRAPLLVPSSDFRTLIRRVVPPELYDAVARDCILYDDARTVLPTCDTELPVDPGPTLDRLRANPLVAAELNRLIIDLIGARVSLDVLGRRSAEVAGLLAEPSSP